MDPIEDGRTANTGTAYPDTNGFRAHQHLQLSVIFSIFEARSLRSQLATIQTALPLIPLSLHFAAPRKAGSCDDNTPSSYAHNRGHPANFSPASQEQRSAAMDRLFDLPVFSGAWGLEAEVT